MSDILTRKTNAHFKHLDLNNDGYISLKDFVEMAERHCDTEKTDAAEREKVTGCFAKVWRLWMKSAGSDDNGLLTPSIFVESIKQQKNDPEFKKAYLAMCLQFFRILDVNGDGFLQEEEYARSFGSVGIQDKGVIRRAFEAIDLNQDGKLSLEEFSTALFENLTSEDEKSRYTELLGLLDK